jgi:hypothetical protein
VYLTFTEYQAMGGDLSETDFIQAEFIARKKINELTFSRLTNETPIRESVKMCIFGLIERGYCGSLDGKKIKSESLEGALYLTYEFDKEGANEFIRACLSDETENLFYCGN